MNIKAEQRTRLAPSFVDDKVIERMMLCEKMVMRYIGVKQIENECMKRERERDRETDREKETDLHEV